MALTEETAIFDNVRHTVTVVVCARPGKHASPDEAYSEACRRIEAIEARMRVPRRESTRRDGHDKVTLTSNMTRDEFCAMVRRAKDYIVEGDIIQAVLSQRFSTEVPADPLTLYRAEVLSSAAVRLAAVVQASFV